jgi:hypothetical protein
VFKHNQFVFEQKKKHMSGDGLVLSLNKLVCDLTSHVRVSAKEKKCNVSDNEFSQRHR